MIGQSRKMLRLKFSIAMASKKVTSATLFILIGLPYPRWSFWVAYQTEYQLYSSSVSAKMAPCISEIRLTSKLVWTISTIPLTRLVQNQWTENQDHNSTCIIWSNAGCYRDIRLRRMSLISPIKKLLQAAWQDKE